MRMLIKRLSRYATVTCLGIIAMGCGPQRVPPGLVYCSEGNPESFNPQLVTSGTTVDATSHQIYNGLVDYDAKSGQIIPSLATKWHISEDELTYTFTLRKGVSFHQSRDFTPSRAFNADDVLFSFNRIIDINHPYHFVSKTGYPFFQSIGFDKQVNLIEKISDNQVAFHLNSRDASFLSNLASGFGVILSAEYAQVLAKRDEKDKIDRLPIGTGPFQLRKYVKNEYIRYHRHEQYWRTLPKSEMLVFDITPKSTSRLAKLITGDCSVSALPKAGELAVVLAHDELVIDSQPGFNVAFWAFNTQKPPFDDVRVRRALAHAIDRENILRVVYQKTAVKAMGLLPPMSWAYSENKPIINFDPQEAKRLLKEANVTNLTIDIWAMPVARIYNPNALKTAELIQADLANIGVKVNIVSYDWSVFNQKLSQHSYDSVLIGWTADNSDPDNFFTPILSCSSVTSSSNRSRWCHHDLDLILAQARSTTNIEERKKFYQAAEAIFASQLPMLPLAHATKLAFKRKGVTDMKLTPFGGISFTGEQTDAVPNRPKEDLK
ncbi:ABC transporter substrate-binding protein [Shewanella sp. D64]|uniref:ABC transporter substrate-binding protein n=1 Tax=unclassified Shewanella TaxID=196818 RepID=UPI0022BA677B|nr:MULTISPECIES: ABC transporter substrate-binding protein [unclassified Shewanella]MEC4728363.1 ABC transporter substrate-binding protein [Shewanella sp. D64]MEC4737303.1 ABC transporter substrate-binding protein [Shewanella sp. E94]WBJ93680.1 ABC transporter substrate-binding protein [Shewanella sp. MTB7]